MFFLIYYTEEQHEESELDKRARTVLKTDRSVMSWLGGRTYTLRLKTTYPQDRYVEER